MEHCACCRNRLVFDLHTVSSTGGDVLLFRYRDAAVALTDKAKELTDVLLEAARLELRPKPAPPKGRAPIPPWLEQRRRW